MSGSSLFRFFLRRSQAKKPFCVDCFFGTSAGVAKVGEVSLTEFVSIDGIVFSPICGAGIINERESFFVCAGYVIIFSMAILDEFNK